MPPKNNKGKKKSQDDPRENPKTLRRREQEMKTLKKKCTRAINIWCRKQQGQMKLAASNDCDEENAESLERERSCEERGHENINLPSSSCTEPSTSHSLVQQEIHENDKVEDSNNINPPNSSEHISSTSCITGLEVSQQKEKKKKKKKKKNESGGACSEEMSLIETKSLEVKTPENTTEINKVGGNVSDTGRNSSQNISVDYFYDSRLHRGEHLRTQVKAENKEKAQKETIKPTENIEFASNTSKNAPTTEDGISTEDGAKHKLQQKLEAKENKVAEQEKELLPLAKENNIAVSGVIKIRSISENVKSIANARKLLPYSSYTSDNDICLEDENIQISIHVNQGSQVVCKSRRIPKSDLVENDKSGSGSREVAAGPDADIKTYSEKYDKTTSDIKCDSISVGQLSSKHNQTVDEEATDNSGIDTLIESAQQDETSTEVKCESRTISNLSKENDQTVDEEATDNSVTDTLIEYAQQDEASTEVKCESRSISNLSKENDQTVDEEATDNSVTDILIESAQQDETSTEIKCESSTISNLSQENDQTVDEEATDNSGTDALIESAQQDETSTEVKCESSTIGNLSKENDSSENFSLNEELRKICEEFSKDRKSAYEKHERRVAKYIERNLSNSSEI